MVTPCTWGRVDTLFRDACLPAGLGWAAWGRGAFPSELTSEATTWHLPQLSNPSVTGRSEKDPCTINHTCTHAPTHSLSSGMATPYSQLGRAWFWLP